MLFHPLVQDPYSPALRCTDVTTKAQNASLTLGFSAPTLKWRKHLTWNASPTLKSTKLGPSQEDTLRMMITAQRYWAPSRILNSLQASPHYSLRTTIPPDGKREVLKGEQTSRQDGGVGRYTLLPHTTKKTTTNLKTKDNQNCQKIELYRSLTTKELKKKHSTRLVGGEETGSQGRKDMRWGGCCRPGSPTCGQINQEEQQGGKRDHITQSSSTGKLSLKTSGCKNLWGLQQWE